MSAAERQPRHSRTSFVPLPAGLPASIRTLLVSKSVAPCPEPLYVLEYKNQGNFSLYVIKI